MKATYSPEDNKLRLRSEERLDGDLYARVKARGFRYAPKQGLFVAPMWTPSREDLLLELCGEIGDEDTSLVERSEIRAERFDDYSDKRADDAHRAKDEAAELTGGNLDGGLTIGHHSEKQAQKQADKIKRTMEKAVQMWETSEYWTRRAAGAIRSAKYKERADVRARRIKKLEADKRKQGRNKADAVKFLKYWNHPEKELTLDRARAISNYENISFCFTLEEYPRPESSSQYEGPMGLWSALGGEVITPEQAKDLATRAHCNEEQRADRWLAHIENRLTYEKAMLGEQGASDLLKPIARPKQLPLVNYRAPEGLKTPSLYHRGEVEHFPQVEMTAAEYKKIYTDQKGTRIIDGSHRVRIALVGSYMNRDRVTVFLTDSKVHEKPEPMEKKEPEALPEVHAATIPTRKPKEKTDFDDMKEALKDGVNIVVAPQLFPTPNEIATQMIELADIQPGEDILEPSAGTGNLIGAMGGQMFNHNPKGGSIKAVEINFKLAEKLRSEFPLTEVITADFLTLNDLGKFDKIIMNPPFERGVDIKHIRHAQSMLKDGGKLVALCANGPRQREAFMNEAEQWEDLPEGSFKAQGTGVNVAMFVLKNNL